MWEARSSKVFVLIILNKYTTTWRNSVTRFFASGFFHESVSPKPLIIQFAGRFKFLLKIRGDRYWNRFLHVSNNGGREQCCFMSFPLSAYSGSKSAYCILNSKNKEGFIYIKYGEINRSTKMKYLSCQILLFASCSSPPDLLTN